MTISRRGFLKSIIAAAMAPAIVRSESLMKLYVPSQDLIIPTPISLVEGFGEGDFTVETWIKPSTEGWKHIAQVSRAGGMFFYINGEEISGDKFDTHGFKVLKKDGQYELSFAKKGADTCLDLGTGRSTSFNGQIDDLRIASLAREPSSFSINQQSLVGLDVAALNNQIFSEVNKFERGANKGIQAMESFVDRAEALSRQKPSSALLKALLKNV